MSAEIQAALRKDLTIDITVTGRKTGEERRWEIWFHNVDDRIFITGTPGRRDWYANLVANPDFTFHLKESLQADLPAKATPITDADTRREIFKRIHERLEGERDLEEWVADSPLLEIELAY